MKKSKKTKSTLNGIFVSKGETINWIFDGEERAPFMAGELIEIQVIECKNRPISKTRCIRGS